MIAITNVWGYTEILPPRVLSAFTEKQTSNYV